MPLTLDRVVRAATALVDHRGAAHLTMRGLGAELGVAAMSLYRHVSSREELLDAIADDLVDQLVHDVSTGSPRGAGWRELVCRWAEGMRDLRLAHPGAFALLATRRRQVSWLRPPLSSARGADAFVGDLLARGFTSPQAAVTYRWFTAFVIGQRTPAQPPADPGLGRWTTAHQFPALQRVGSSVGERDGSADFDDALADLVRRIERLAPPPR